MKEQKDIQWEKRLEEGFRPRPDDDASTRNDLEAMKDVLQRVDRFGVPAMDKTGVFNRIQREITAPAVPVRRIIRWLGAAAALVIAFLLFPLIFKSDVSTEISAVETVVHHQLLDRSSVELGPGSSLAYDADFEDKRLVNLRGKALFHVEKGKTFTVQVARGTVTVLGTVFEIIENPGGWFVHCYEGSVRVEGSNTNEVITAGQSIQLDDQNRSVILASNEVDFPVWTPSGFRFTDTDLSAICAWMSRWYGVQFDLTELNEERNFSGILPGSDVQKALEILILTTGLEFQMKDNSVTVRE